MSRDRPFLSSQHHLFPPYNKPIHQNSDTLTSIHIPTAKHSPSQNIPSSQNTKMYSTSLLLLLVTFISARPNFYHRPSPILRSPGLFYHTYPYTHTQVFSLAFPWPYQRGRFGSRADRWTLKPMDGFLLRRRNVVPRLVVRLSGGEER